MRPEKSKIVEETMLREFRDFVLENRRAPMVREYNDKSLFQYGYGTYRNRFRYLEELARLTGTEELAIKPKKTYPRRQNPDIKTYKIRDMLEKNKDTGYSDLEKMFGTVTRSIRVTYYKVHKEMFGTSGSLKH